MTPKIFRKTMAGLLAAALLGTGAAPNAFAATPADTLVIARNIADIITLDPAEVFEPVGGEIVNNFYTRLITYDTETFSKLQGGVAESWDVSADGKTISFSIRPDLTFQSGNPVRAEDAAYSLQRVVKLGLTPSFILTQYGWTPENVEQKVRVENGKLLIELNKPWAPTLVLNTLTSGVGSVVDEKVVRQHEKNGDQGHAWLKTNTAGSGAYKLNQWKAGEVIVLDAFDKFYLGKAPLKRTVVRHVAEPATQLLLLEKGDIDIARDLQPEHYQNLPSKKNLIQHEEQKVSLLYLGLNLTHPALAEPKVREALRYLVDYDGISNELLGGSWKTQQFPVPNGILGSISEKPFKLDPAKAKSLLAEAGHPDGFDITLNVQNAYPYPVIAQALQASFAQAGVRLKLDQVDPAQFWQRFRERKADLNLGYWSHDYNDPHSTVDFLLSNPDNSDNASSRSGAWRLNWQPAGQEVVQQLALERDASKRKQGYEAYQRSFGNNSPVIILVQQHEQTGIREGVEGFKSGPTFDTPIYWQVRKP